MTGTTRALLAATVGAHCQTATERDFDDDVWQDLFRRLSWSYPPSRHSTQFEMVVLSNSVVQSFSHHSVALKHRQGKFAVIAELVRSASTGEVGWMWELLGDLSVFEERLRTLHLKEHELGEVTTSLYEFKRSCQRVSFLGQGYETSERNCQCFVAEVVGQFDGIDANKLPQRIIKLLLCLFAGVATATVATPAAAVIGHVAAAEAAAAAAASGAAGGAAGASPAVAMAAPAAAVATAASAPAAGVGAAGVGLGAAAFAAAADAGPAVAVTATSVAGGTVLFVGVGAFFLSMALIRMDDATMRQAEGHLRGLEGTFRGFSQLPQRVMKQIRDGVVSAHEVVL
eukprot:CAMPEP_0115377244 /NCGR_PEP_ID=MMETSP0271-20121206/3389_1 /TAXON_ID=71861 /ORGANISM="Scrippsiella trochoidea, Strain CCMP3099" /LENGTH=341 /DNA_ID=CAMNT_0002800355 /DNA_START=68 /DNA_END=1093 /DNA_ORIENTATION=-